MKRLCDGDVKIVRETLKCKPLGNLHIFVC